MKRIYVYLWIGVLITLIGDVFTTYVGLQNGLVEYNPFTAYLIGSAGMVGLVKLKLIGLGAALVLRQIVIPDREFIIPAALTFTWGMITVLNVIAIYIA